MIYIIEKEDELQRALDNAKSGDWIRLEKGFTITSTLTLKPKTGVIDSWIVTNCETR